jgi:hypothetical protein
MPFASVLLANRPVFNPAHSADTHAVRMDTWRKTVRRFIIQLVESDYFHSADDVAQYLVEVQY